MPTKLDLMVRGCANGHPVRYQGSGSIAGQRLRFAVWPTEGALDFDHSVVLTTCMDPLLAAAADLTRPLPKSALVARSRIDLLGEGGVAVGTIVASAVVERQKGRLTCRTQLAEAQVAMEVGERVMSVEARTSHLAVQPDGASLMSTTTIATSRGKDWTALATTKVVECEAAGEAGICLPAFRIRRVRHQDSMQLTLAVLTTGSR